MSINERDLAELRESHLISDEQGEQISRYIQQTEKIAIHRWVGAILLLLGALMLVTGITQLIVSYNDERPRLTIVTMSIAMLGCAWWQWYRNREENSEFAQVMALSAAVIWSGSVCWVNAIYSPNIFGDDSLLLTATCFAGFMFMPFLSRQVVMVGLSVVCSLILWNGISGGEESVLSFNLGEHYPMLRYGVYMLILLGWALLGEKWRLNRGNFRDYGWISVPTYIFFFLFLRYKVGDVATDETPFSSLICLGVPLLYAVIRPEGQAGKPWMLLGVVTGLFMFTVFLPLLSVNRFACEMAWIVVGTLYVATFIGCGVKCRRAAWVNYGIIVLLLMMQLVASKIFDSMEESGLALLVMGFLLLPLTFFIERTRRSLVNMAKQTTQPS